MSTSSVPRAVAAVERDDGPASAFRLTPPRPLAVAAVGFAALFALVATTTLVLSVVSIGPASPLGVPVVLAGGLVIVAAPTVVWRVGVDAVEAANRARPRE